MKKIFLFLSLLISFAVSYGQLTPVQKVASIIQLKAYNGSAAFVYVSDSSKLYATCSPCVANETTIFAGVGGKKWKVSAGSSSGGGLTTIPSWQQTINVDRNNSGQLVFDSAMAMPPDINTPATKTWLRFEPLVSAYDSINAPFYWHQGAFRNNGKPNEVMLFGWNMGAGGGAAQPGKAGLGESWESNYQISPTGFGARLVEKHEMYIRASTGIPYRLSSFTINDDANTINYYNSADNFDFRNHIAGLPYFGGQGVTNISSLKMSNIAVENQNFAIDGSFAETGTRSAFRITSEGSKADRVFGVENFTNAELPGVVTIDNGAASRSAQINFYGKDELLGTIVQDSAKLSINSYKASSKILFAAANLNIATWSDTRLSFAKPVIIGLDAVPVAMLDVRETLGASGASVSNTSLTASKYGLEVNSSAGTNNTGLYVQAFNGSGSNKAIEINNTTVAGVDDYAIYSPGVGLQSYFNGEVQMASAKIANLSTGWVKSNASGVLSSVSTIDGGDITTGTVAIARIDTATIKANIWPAINARAPFSHTHLAADLPATVVYTSAANAFTNNQTITKTTEQLRLAYDVSNNVPFTVTSGGDLGIVPSGGDLNVTGNININSSNIAKSYSRKAMEALGSNAKAFTYATDGFNITTTTAMVDGTRLYNAAWLNSPETITGIKFYQGTQGVFTGNNFNGIALFSYSAGVLTQVAITANDANIWKGTSNTWQTVAFTTPVALQPDIYFYCFMYSNDEVATPTPTAPAIGVAQAWAASGLPAGDFTNSAKITANQTSQTTMPASVNMTSLSGFTTRQFAILY